MPSLAGSGEVAGTEDLPAVAISSDGHTVLQGVFSLNSSAGAAWTFISQSPPVVTGLSPSTGSAAGGTTVIISGQNFLSPATVMFGQNAATSVVVNGTGQITATSPPETPVLTSSQTVDVVVGSNFGLSVANDLDVFTYLPAATPAVTSVAPASGPVAGGTSVAISGSGFLNASAVKFGTNNAVSYAVNSDNQILATSPTGSGTVDVVVTAPGGTSPTSSADHFAYSLPPVVIGISPSSGPVIGGTIVTINGANFTGVTPCILARWRHRSHSSMTVQ
jgi:IPT/TIG domain